MGCNNLQDTLYLYLHHNAGLYPKTPRVFAVENPLSDNKGATD